MWCSRVLQWCVAVVCCRGVVCDAGVSWYTWRCSMHYTVSSPRQHNAYHHMGVLVGRRGCWECFENTLAVFWSGLQRALPPMLTFVLHEQLSWHTMSLSLFVYQARDVREFMRDARIGLVMYVCMCMCMCVCVCVCVCVCAVCNSKCQGYQWV